MGIHRVIADSCTRACAASREHEAEVQGLTLVHFSAQPKPCVSATKTHPKHSLALPDTPLNYPQTTPERTPCTTKSTYVELKSERG
jgi:hypothetical protein